MIGSKNTYFFQDEVSLKKGRKVLILYLKIWNYSFNKRNIYLKAFDYFCINPTQFDGATIVKDLCHIPNLDVNAMLHDYQYIVCRCASHPVMKIKCDYLYAKEMEKLGKGQLAWWRFSYLKIVGIPFGIYTACTKGFPKEEQRINFFNDYEILTNNK